MKKRFHKILLGKLITQSVLCKPGLYTFINPYTYLVARNDVNLIKNFDGIYVDGEYLAKFIRFFLNTPLTRISFDMTSAAPTLLSWAENNNKRIALIGTTQENIEKTRLLLLESYPKLRIVYTRNGFFKCREEREHTLSKLAELVPDFIIVGMGAPLQERFLVDVWEKGWRGLGVTCGGFFHQSATGLSYYPEWANRLNLRWLYRIYDEPRLIKRYLVYYPLFVVKFLTDWLNLKCRDKSRIS